MMVVGDSDEVSDKMTDAPAVCACSPDVGAWCSLHVCCSCWQTYHHLGTLITTIFKIYYIS